MPPSRSSKRTAATPRPRGSSACSWKGRTARCGCTSRASTAAAFDRSSAGPYPLASVVKTPLAIWKCGGAALADAAAVRHAIQLVRKHKGPLVVVPSALAGVTDLLLDGGRRAAAGDV